MQDVFYCLLTEGFCLVMALLYDWYITYVYIVTIMLFFDFSVFEKYNIIEI